MLFHYCNNTIVKLHRYKIACFADYLLQIFFAIEWESVSALLSAPCHYLEEKSRLPISRKKIRIARY